LDRVQVTAAFPDLGDGALLETLLEDLRRAGRVRLTETSVALAGCGPKLSPGERKLLAELLDAFRAAGIQSPSVNDCQQRAAKHAQAVPHLIALAVADGDLIAITSDYYLHADVDRSLQTALRERLAGSQGATLSEIREWLNTTRKYAVPYCEYLDRIGFTRRAGDLRYLTTNQRRTDP
jgi:selenocysteine-specific elongation factor